MAEMELDNDTRGWIMCVISGIACVVGASIICVDVLVRLIPSKRNFRIQDSNVFLASSLSLSFGVMLFSALYSMLPNSKKYLIMSGFIPSSAAWILLAGFVGGFVGIQIVSRFLHHYIPSHVVDCDHSHDEGGQERRHGHDHGHNHGSQHEHNIQRSSRGLSRGRAEPRLERLPEDTNGKASESTPLLLPTTVPQNRQKSPKQSAFGGDGSHSSKHSKRRAEIPRVEAPISRRPSMIEVQKRVLSFVKDTKSNCDSTGPCFGYSDPCGQECFKHLNGVTPNSSRHPSTLRTSIANIYSAPTACPLSDDENVDVNRLREPSITRVTRAHSHMDFDDDDTSEDLEAQHHHHVPENAFMSIGLQTAIAIALHKLPEGFITYATNHANPALGFSVFMALFVHNITEGFAMALPLFLALHSRFRAMFWASLLGGASQPMGAGIAAAWFKIAGNEGHKPGSTAYGVMFAITAGIMTSVALQLFVESLSLNHNRNLCIGFAFIGMAIMGASNALTS